MEEEKKVIKGSWENKLLEESDFIFFTNVSSELSEMKNEDAVFEYINKKLIDILPNTIILITRSNPEFSKLRLDKIHGLQNQILYKLITSIGFNPIGRSYNITDEFKLKYSKPKIRKFDGTLSEFCNNEITEPLCLFIEKTLKLRSIHTIGIADTGQFFGFVHFMSTDKSEILNYPLLELFIYLCYLSIARIRSVTELEEREKQYKLLADNVKDVIFTLDLNLNYTYISPSIKSLRGYEPSELLGKPVLNTLSPESYSRITKIFKEEFEKIEKGELSDERLFEVELVHRNNNLIWTEIKASFIFDSQKKPIGILGVTRNVNDRKLAENELLKKNMELNEANAQKDKFFSIIAHDLKSPFGHILNFSSLLKDHYRLYSEDKRIQFIDLINKSSHQIYLLLENLLDWSRSQGGKMDFFPQKIKLEKVTTDVVELLNNSAVSKNISLIKNIPSKATLYADEYMLKTILRNLIGNAVKFTPEGGKVRIEVMEEKGRWVISVIDNGIGMDIIHTHSLFNLNGNISKSGTKGEKGTGLGLLLCKEFVEIHGGKIWVESTLKKGSTFSFTIPVKME